MAPQIREVFAREKEDSLNRAVLRRYVYQFSRWSCPYRMKFGFYENARKFPQGPPKHYVSTFVCDCCIYERKTFVGRGALFGTNWNVRRLAILGPELRTVPPIRG